VEKLMIDRERDVQDLAEIIGRRHVTRCRGCDRYILISERDSCPHCSQEEVSLDTRLGRVHEMIRFYEPAG
jgi:rRNA maturation endonuclease Nob1